MSGRDGWIVVQNDGELDLRLLELMGASTKDGESSIGLFGTGWKYGLALALRKGLGVYIFSGTQTIAFSTMEETIRGKTFHRIAYSINGKRRRKTSMTTALGKADWNDEWMFLREVIANAFDEGGFHTYSVEGEDLSGIPVKSGVTSVCITRNQRVQEILDNMEHYVRRHGSTEETPYGHLFEPLGDKGRIYKRGIFVRELESPTLFDYDLKGIKLTESRSADSWDIQYEIRKVLKTCSLETRRKVLRNIERVGEDPLYEASLDFSDWEGVAQKSWSEAFLAEYGDDAVLCEGSQIVKESIEGLGRRAITMPEKVAQALRKGKQVVTEQEVVGKAASEGFVYRAFTEYESQALSKSKEVMKLIFGDRVDKIPVRLFKAEGEHADIDSRVLKETDGSDFVLINERVFSGGVRPVIEILYEELLHMAGQYSPDSETLLNSAKKSLFETLLPKTGVIL